MHFQTKEKNRNSPF